MATENENFEEEKNSGFDTESNLFDTIGDNPNEDDNDDINDEFENESFLNDEEEEEDEDEENEDSEGLLKEIDKNDDTKAPVFSQKELDVLNKKLGTDYKSIDDLKKEFNKSEREVENEKENNDYKLLNNKVSLYERYIVMDDEKLIREQLLSVASQENKDIEDQDVINEVEERIQGLIDLDQLKGMAETLRTNLKFSKEKDELAIGKIEEKRTLSEKAIAEKNTDDLQNAFADIFTQGKFLGVDVTEESIHRAYESVRTNKFYDAINNNQEMIAKFAMFLEHENEISKSSNKPTHSDNTKDAFNFLSGTDKQKRRSITQANGSASSGGSKENIMNFIK